MPGAYPLLPELLAPSDSKPRARPSRGMVQAINAALAVLACWTLWTTSMPGGPAVLSSVALDLLWPALGIFWLIWLIVALGEGWPRRAVAHFLVAPAVVLVVVALLRASEPLQARVALSRGAMASLAAKVTSSRPGTLFADQPVGLFRASEIERVPGGMRFVVSEELTTDYGFAYSPSRPPRPSQEDYDYSSYEHLTGPWYVWTRRIS